MAECKNCIHIGVCGKLIFCERDGTVACDDYKDRSNLAEVVRCKDCHWCEQGKSYEPYCNHPTDGMHDVQLDDFCSYGERKDNDNQN
jgi:hypothetical protein